MPYNWSAFSTQKKMNRSFYSGLKKEISIENRILRVCLCENELISSFEVRALFCVWIKFSNPIESGEKLSWAVCIHK